MNFNKPEYLYRPSAAFKRGSPLDRVSVKLPSGLALVVNPSEDIGRTIYRLRVYDLPVTEALTRLTDENEVAFDVGANIGYMVAVFASRKARVYAFEPHPTIHTRLADNASRWNGVQVFNVALSDRDSRACLSEPPSGNEGTARLVADGEHIIECRRMESLELPAPHVLKLDVEGHELFVLRGMGQVRPRDIVFEEHTGYPSPVTAFLESAGYSIFNLGVSLLRPLLCPPSEPRSRAWEPQSFLATLDQARARERYEARGWRCLVATG